MPSTRWTIIARLHSRDDKQVRRALDDLCAQYHYPLYCYIRLRGLSHQDAEDALHDFLAKLLRLDAFDDLAAEKGRLRTFLSKSLDRFLINRHHRDRKRNEREVLLEDTRFPLDPKLEQRFERELGSSADSPDVIFDRQWCAQLLQRVMQRLGTEYEGRKAPVFSALQPVLITGGSLRGHDAAALAAGLSMTEGALRTALLRLLRDYRRLLVDEVRQTVDRKEDVEAEIAHLMQALTSRA